MKNLTEYGAFVDLGGIDGLLHITDMSWGRLTHPQDLVNVGDQIQVKVLKFDKDKQRVSLGFKQLTPDSGSTPSIGIPWVTHRRPRHQRDRLRRIRGTGAGHRRPGAHQRDDLVEADEASVETGERERPGGLRAAQRESVERRISLGMRQLASNPWDSLHDKFPVGMTVEGRVRNLTDFGAFIEIEDGIHGLVDVSI